MSVFRDAVRERLILIIAGVLLSTPGQADVVVVDFDAEPSSSCLGLGASLSTQGFTFTSPTNSLFSCDGTASSLASNGTPSLLDANFFSTPTMVEENGRPFSLLAFDAADRNVSGTGNATSIQVEGTRLDGSTVVVTFPLDGINDGPGGVDDFETMVLPASFSGLVSVTFVAQPPVDPSEFILDNLAVQAATVVDFDAEPSGSCLPLGASLNTQGFTFTSPTNSLFSCDGTVSSLASNGTPSLLDANFFSTPTMVEENGRPFSLLAFDAADRNVSGTGNATSIQLEGTRLDGSTVVVTFPLDGINDGPGGVDDFETMILPASFSGLVSVTFVAQPPVDPSEFILDNLAVQAATVVDFDAEPSGSCLGLGASLSTQGFTFTSPTNSLFSCDGTASGLASNGTPALIDANFVSTPTLVEQNGFSFNLLAFDAADRNVSGVDNATSIQVEGTRFDGSTVSASFPLDGINDGPGGVDDFETFVLPGSFNRLLSVTFAAQPPVSRSEFLFDNVIVSPAVAPTAPVSAVVDFDGEPSGSCLGLGASLSTQGFNFTSPTNSLFSCDGTLNFLASNGTPSLIDANFFSSPTMVEQSGFPFGLLAFDAAERNVSGAGNATSIQVEGLRVDGSTVVANFPLDGWNDGPGEVDDFETFVLPASFGELTSVTFVAQPPVDPSEFLFDNVIVGNLRDPGPIVLTFPGPTPCDLSLQACINSALPGDTIEIATNTPIDESLSIEKSLTLRAASGFSPTIGTGVGGTFRRIDVQTDEENAMNVVIEGLNVDHGQVEALMFNGDSHNIVFQDLVILNGQDSNNTHGIEVDLRARESHALVQRNRIRSNGQGIRVFGSLPTNGPAVYFTNFTLLANEITGFEQPNNNSGIEVDIRGVGEATVLLHSNLIYGMAGCNCGGASGVDISALDLSVVNAFVTNNTIDDSQISSDGLNALARDSATINLSLYNNIISNSTRSGVDVGTTVPTATVNVQNDYNSFWNNTDPNDWNGGAEGPNSGSFDPDYVDPTTADYRPGLLAAVRNIGTLMPPGGLPEIDAKNGPRLVGAGVELGALEDASALLNGSFESDQLPSPTRQGIENVTVWIATGGFSLLERAINGVSQISAQDGLQFVSMGHNGATGTVLEQAFPTTPGEFYEARFWVRAIQGSTATGQDLEVRVLDSDGLLLNSSATEVDVFDGWSQHTLVFFASTEQSVIEIEDTGESDTANIALDNVTISPVPEPGVGAALMSGGLALLALRRRRQAAVD